MKKTWYSLKNRVTAMLLALICVLGLLPTAALAAGADTIKLERFGMSGVSYQSASLGRCTMHQMYYGVAGKTSEMCIRDSHRSLREICRTQSKKTEVCKKANLCHTVTGIQ